jgi:hypothetical protein
LHLVRPVAALLAHVTCVMALMGRFLCTPAVGLPFRLLRIGSLEHPRQ